MLLPHIMVWMTPPWYCIVFSFGIECGLCHNTSVDIVDALLNACGREKDILQH
jgi:hypothetical protein